MYSPLSEKSVAIIDQLINILKVESNQKLYDQCEIANPTDCGTICCLAGWIHLIEKGPETHLAEVKELRRVNEVHKIIDFAEDVMRLEDGSLADTRTLFGTADEWPTKYQEYYNEAISDKGRAFAAIQVLEEFKETGSLDHYNDYDDWDDIEDEDENEDSDDV